MPDQDPIRVLAVDDDVRFCELLADTLTGMSVATVTSEADAFARVHQFDFDVVLTDLNLGGAGGIAVVQRVAELDAELPVIVITAFGSIDTAVAAMRAGAYDFVTKPIEIDQLRFTIQRAAATRGLRREVRKLRERIEGGADSGIIGESVPTRRMLERVDRFASVDAPVLLRGESGAGKEIVAHAIHLRSRRRDAPWVAVNVAALPTSLIEAELFGHTRGAFTGANEKRQGLFVRADGGTLLLDEIGELPIDLQPKLLRALEERVVRPVGSDSDVPFDVRVIAATNRDLEAAVEAGSFREDLFFRLSVLDLEVPPLRVRGRDILLLAQHFLQRFASAAEKNVREIGPDAAQRLLDYPWPGNVRELRNAIERAVTLADGSALALLDFPERIRSYARSDVLVVSHNPTELVPLEIVEQRYILRVLEAVGDNKTQAAKILGLGRKTLYRKLERYGVMVRSERSSSPEEDAAESE
ncbi:MAG: sigma-54-dependent Fis family transcriptional regulator [Deltaproteobacteria bacterium]|nr:sigma-54-dependent Fis family transcriptional regulator [Nannocystaceae bacterium]